MIEQLNSIAGLWWGWILAVSWQVGLLIVLIACLDRLIRRWAWPQLRYALWSLVLIKLILPPTMSLPSGVVPELRPMVGQMLSRMRVQKPGAEEGSAGISDFGFRIGDSVLETGAPSMVVTPLSRTEVRFNESVSPSRDGHPQAALEGATPTANSQSAIANPQLEWQVYAMIVWFSGTLILGTWLLVRLRSFTGRYGYRAAAASLPQSFYDRMAGCAKRLGLRRVPRVVVTRRVPTPAVFGVFRPVLLMPKGYLRRLSRKDTEHMLLHELAHIKRGDLLTHSLYMLLQIVHWYNPLLWLVRRQLHHLRELSCDATVAELLRERTGAYRQTLLETARRLLATSAEPGLGLLGLFEDSNRLATRLNWLARPTWRYKTMKRAIVVTIVALMFVCVLPMAQGQGPIVAEEKTEQNQAETPSAEELKALQAKLEKLEIERRKLQQELQALAQARQGTQQAAAETVQAARAAADARAQVQVTRAQAAQAASEARRAQAVSRAQASRARAKAKRVQIYTIQPGDTLASIAEKFYGEGNGATPENIARIIEINKLDGADGIRVGQELAIPLGRNAGDSERVVVMPAPPKAPQWGQPGAQKRWQDWAEEMEAWGEQMQQWEQSEAMQQWQADIETWEDSAAMKQWEKDLEKWAKERAKASRKSGKAPADSALTPMPVMPGMPAMPSMPAPPVAPVAPPEVVAPTVPVVAAPQPMPRPVPRTEPRQIVVPKVKSPKAKLPKIGGAAGASIESAGLTLKSGQDGLRMIQSIQEKKEGDRHVLVRAEQTAMKLAPGSALNLINEEGAISIVGSNGDTCQVQSVFTLKAPTADAAKALSKAVHLETKSTDEGLTIIAVEPQEMPKQHSARVDLQIVVPRNTDLGLKHGDGVIRIKNIEGNIAAYLEDGEIRCQDVAGAMALHLEDGRVVIDRARLAACSIHMEDGQIACDEITGSLDINLEDGAVAVTYADELPESCEIKASLEEGSIKFSAPKAMFGTDAPAKAKRRDEGAEWKTTAQTAAGARSVTLRVEEGSVKVDKR